MTTSIGFDLLHEGVKRWIWKQGWSALHKIQEEAIVPILSADQDVVISAATAAGKTEAAFLPACSQLASSPSTGVGILYFSPLKALINDQFRRLESLAASIDVAITPWHGDSPRSLKDLQRKQPNGIILITPESFESLMLNHSSWCYVAFVDLRYVIVDEFHAFLGTERGCQLLSLMHRLEFRLQRTIPRIGLSATLGNLDEVAAGLRAGRTLPSKIIQSTGSRTDLKIQLRGYTKFGDQVKDDVAPDPIGDDLFRLLRGSSHLVFANSRGRTEKLSAGLADRCETAGLPNEFFPHHGSLSKEIRQSVEARLNQRTLPTTAICTSTLELGIDIGNVESIAQVTAPHTVASLRQRLGRSGRRDHPAILRLFITEEEITDKTHIQDRLRLETFQCVAMVNLLLRKWYEPPLQNEFHFSTLVQQTLSVLGQYGGVRADQLWRLLCETGPFRIVSQSIFGKLLQSLGTNELITQMRDGQLTLGERGEKLVEHYTFYAAFQTPEEYRLEFEGRPLGTLPIDYPISPGQLLIFAGRRWEIVLIDPEKKLVSLKRAARGRPPLFGGGGASIHRSVRKEMRETYVRGDIPVYLDGPARTSFAEGVDYFKHYDIERNHIVEDGGSALLFPWESDKTSHTLAAMLRANGLLANAFAGVIEIMRCDENRLRQALAHISSQPVPTPSELARQVADTKVEKHDKFLSEELLHLGYGAKHFDVQGASDWLSKFLSEN